MWAVAKRTRQTLVLGGQSNVQDGFIRRCYAGLTKWVLLQVEPIVH